MNTLQTVEELGLKPNEARVYLALLEHGDATASDIARDLHLKRTTAYPLLTKLGERGFVSITIKHHRHYYRAEQPERVLEFYQRKLSAFEQLLPSLKALTDKAVHETAGVRYIENVAGLKQLYYEDLERYRGKTFRIISNNEQWENFDGSFLHDYLYDRAKANIKTKLLLTENSKPFSSQDPKLKREVKFLPPQWRFDSTINIYPESISVVAPTKNGLAVVIDIPVMADVFQTVFDMLWEFIPEQQR